MQTLKVPAAFRVSSEVRVCSTAATSEDLKSHARPPQMSIFAGKHSPVCSHALSPKSTLHPPHPLLPMSRLPGWVYETEILCMCLSCTAHSLAIISAIAPGFLPKVLLDHHM